MEIVKLEVEDLPKFSNKPKEPVTFSPEEWCWFVKEIEERGGKEIEKCVNNARYLAKIYKSRASEYGIKMTLAELEKLASL